MNASHLAQAAGLLALLAALTPSGAQVPTPQNTPWLGPLTVAVDATDLDHRILRVHETLPVQPGPLTLLFPRWLPGDHGPYGETHRLAGLVVSAGSATLPWRRDPLDPQVIHVDVPAGVARLALDFQHLSPVQGGDDRTSMTRAIVGIQWETAVLYPAGHHASAIQVEPRLRLPAGWQAGTALRAADGRLAAAAPDAWWTFGPVSLETLVDSPVFAGRFFKRIELDDPGAAHPVALDLVADTAAGLEAGGAQIEAHRKLVRQADALFGSRHFRHYDLLLALSDEFGGIGLEHHESSENGMSPSYFKDWDKAPRGRDLLPHEYTHSWNGKFRRPADLWTPTYNQPMQTTLLWVYEGQTQYWGEVLAARSGLLTAEQARHEWATTAAAAEHRRGRAWRSLQDTTTEENLALNGRGKDWPSWQRGADYYSEGALLWLEVDTLIRTLSGDQRSLDDVARRFLGTQDGRVAPLTYTFEDVVASLAAVQPYDWAGLLRRRLDATSGAGPQEGLTRAGWKLVYTEKESEFASAGDDEDAKQNDFAYSIGLRIAAKDGKLAEVLWESPAFQAGLAPGLTLVAVNLEAYRPERLAEAITANKQGHAPIALLLKDGDHYRTVTLDYRDGLRYPALQRIEGTPDRLAAIIAPR